MNSIEYIYENGFGLGLHPGILSSFSYKLLKSELNNLKTITSDKEFSVRNHWLSNFRKKHGKTIQSWDFLQIIQ